MIFRENRNLGQLKAKEKGLDPFDSNSYYNITISTPVDSTECVKIVSIDRYRIHIVFTFNNSVDNKEYSVEFTGTRKWFGTYQLELTSDFKNTFESCPVL